MKNENWNESATAWMAPGVGVTATFNYHKDKCGGGSHRIYKKDRGTAQAHAESKRGQYIAIGFTCSPIVYRVGA